MDQLMTSAGTKLGDVGRGSVLCLTRNQILQQNYIPPYNLQLDKNHKHAYHKLVNSLSVAASVQQGK